MVGGWVGGGTGGWGLVGGWVVFASFTLAHLPWGQERPYWWVGGWVVVQVGGGRWVCGWCLHRLPLPTAFTLAYSVYTCKIAFTLAQHGASSI